VSLYFLFLLLFGWYLKQVLVEKLIVQERIWALMEVSMVAVTAKHITSGTRTTRNLKHKKSASGKTEALF